MKKYASLVIAPTLVVFAASAASLFGCSAMVEPTEEEAEAIGSIASASITKGSATLISPAQNAMFWVGDSFLDLKGTCAARAGRSPIPIWRIASDENAGRHAGARYSAVGRSDGLSVVNNNHIRVPVPENVGSYTVTQTCNTSEADPPQVGIVVNDVRVSALPPTQNGAGPPFADDQPITFSGSCTVLPPLTEASSRYQPRWSLRYGELGEWHLFGTTLKPTKSLPTGRYTVKLECINVNRDGVAEAYLKQSFAVTPSLARPPAPPAKEKESDCTVM